MIGFVRVMCVGFWSPVSYWVPCSRVSCVSDSVLVGDADSASS